LAAQTIVAKTTGSQDSMVAFPPLKIEGAEKLMPGSSLYFDYPTRNDPAVLLRAADGQYMAYRRKCSHAGCSVEFDRARRCLSCPCHHGIFNASTGDVVYGPPQRPLDQIVLQVRAGGYVWAIGRAARATGEMIARAV
jgi:arsenite oxidase small subunit